MNTINVERCGDGEVLIAARMPTVHQLMESVAVNTGDHTDNRRWEHMSYFMLPTYYNSGMYHTGKWGYRIFTKAPRWTFNLSMLRATSLDEGIEIRLEPNFDFDSPRWKYMERDLGRAVHGLVDKLHADASSQLDHNLSINDREVTL
jgi:hypothetical protein